MSETSEKVVETVPVTMYKVLGEGGLPLIASQYKYDVVKWKLPTSTGRPGGWMPVEEAISMCKRGWHLTYLENVWEWLKPNCYIYTAEGRGRYITEGTEKTNKVCYEQARLLKLVGKLTPLKAGRIAWRVAQSVQSLGVLQPELDDNVKAARNCAETAERCANEAGKSLMADSDYDVVAHMRSVIYSAIDAVDYTYIGEEYTERHQRQVEQYRIIGEIIIQEVGRE